MKVPQEPRFDALDRLTELAEERRLREQEIVTTVKLCRKLGCSWKWIGDALDTTAQSAWERYGLTFRQRQEASRQKDPRWTEEALDLVGLPPSVEPDKGSVTGKRKRAQKPKRDGQ